MADKPAPLTFESDPARYLYVREGRSIRDIARELEGQPDCSRSTLERRCKAQRWREQRAAFLAETAARTTEILVAKEDPVAEAATAPEGSQPEGSEGKRRQVKAGEGSPEKAAEPAWHEEWADQVEQVARVKAKKVAARTTMVDAMVDQAIDGCNIAMSEAMAWLMAQRSRIRDTGERKPGLDADGKPIEIPVLEIEHEDIGWTTRASALSMLSSAVGLLHSLLKFDPVLMGRERMLSLREALARVNMIEARVAGTLPPETVKHMAPDSEEFTEFLRTRLGGQDRLGVLYGGPKQPTTPAEPEPDPHAN